MNACRSSGSSKMAFALGALFRSLEGSWTFQRQITSRLDSAPSGQVDGTATFSLVQPISTEKTNKDQMEYLYSETGSMILAADVKQQSFEVRNKYIWTYDKHDDQLSVYFEDGGSRAHLFNTLRFLPSPSDEELPSAFEKLSGWRAISDHLCGNDNYKSDYLFQFVDNNETNEILEKEQQQLKRIDIVYNVVGPRKDYTSITTYFSNCLS